MTEQNRDLPAVAIEMGSAGLQLKTHEELWRLCSFLNQSGFKPDNVKSQADVFLIVLMGMEVGYSPVTALQSFHVVKGRVALPGETAVALIMGSGKCRDYQSGVSGEGDEMFGWVRSHRVGFDQPNEIVKFTLAEAKRAKLYPGNADSPWAKYTQDMLLWKAVARDYRRNWPDVGKRMPIVEDVRDYDPAPGEINVTPKADAELPPPPEGVDKVLELAGAREPDAVLPPERSESTPAGDDAVLAEAQAKLDAKKGAGETPEVPEETPPDDTRVKASEESSPAPDDAEGEGATEYITPEDRSKLWVAAQKRAQQFVDETMLDAAHRDDCARVILRQVLEDKGYETKDGAPTPILAEDLNSIRSRVYNAKMPAELMSAPPERPEEPEDVTDDDTPF